MPILSGKEQLEQALGALGELLAHRGHHFEIVVIGGANLILRNLTSRPTTRDVDVLGALENGHVQSIRPMPTPLREAVSEVGRLFDLADDWLNLGPDSLLDLGLPAGLDERLERRDYGGLVVWLTGRYDMICFKLYAATDRDRQSRHFQDLQDMHPTEDELVAAARWTMTHDPSPSFRTALGQVLTALGVTDAAARLG